METVSNLTSAASKAIWGDPNKPDTTQGEEPKSGETGDVSSGEPYDKGNEGPIATSTKTAPTSSTTDAPGNATSTMPIRSEHETDKTGVTSMHNATSATSTDKPTSKDVSGAGPAFAADKPTSEEHTRVVQTKKEADEAAKIDTSSPGPKPLSEATKTGEIAGREDDGLQKESHGEGTGKKYVKSSGLKSDGGDFDAANPGAAKEADRLLDSKGVHHEAPGSTDTSGKTATEDNDASESPSGGKLKGLKQKIKAKLHKN